MEMNDSFFTFQVESDAARLMGPILVIDNVAFHGASCRRNDHIGPDSSFYHVGAIAYYIREM